jgi:DDE superfamily endonuclease
MQLIGEVHEPIPAAPGHPVLMDDEYVRNGVANIFIEVEALAGQREVKITATRTRIDWAHFTQEMLEERYPEADKVILVMDNLNTHNVASLYTAFPPEKAKALADRLEIHYTPKHGSWLNIAANLTMHTRKNQTGTKTLGTMPNLFIRRANFLSSKEATLSQDR